MQQLPWNCHEMIPIDITEKAIMPGSQAEEEAKSIQNAGSARSLDFKGQVECMQDELRPVGVDNAT